MLKTKEQLLYYMAGGNIHLSNQDACFFQTLHGIIFRKKQITSNQVKLFNKLIVKYKAQLKRKGHIANDLLSLPWQTEIIESVPEYTQANLTLKEGVLYLRTPFNKIFIQEFTIKTKINPFVWNRDDRNYQAPFSTYALKLATTITKRFFNTINYCPAVESILTQVPNVGDNLIWRPTLIKTNSGYYIAASNSILNGQLKDVVLNDNPNTLYKLSQLGIDSHPSIIGYDGLKEFASEYLYEIDIDHLEKLANWLNQLAITQLVVSREIVGSTELGKEIKAIFGKANIKLVPYHQYLNSSNIEPNIILQLLKSSAWRNATSVSKVVVLKNSRPVKIK